MTHSKDVLIIGGGIAGLTAAAALLKLDCTLPCLKRVIAWAGVFTRNMRRSIR